MNPNYPWNSNDATIRNEYNKNLLEIYPWLELKKYDPASDSYVPYLEDRYSSTELDSLPDGWRVAFGDSICEELDNVIREQGLLDVYRVVQIKEKYASLRWYSNIYNKEIERIIDKYEEISKFTCISCGKPATKISHGWYQPFCNACANKFDAKSFFSIKDFYREETNDEQ